MYSIYNCTLRFLAFCWKLSPFRILNATEFYIFISRCSFSLFFFPQISCHRHHLKTVSIVPILCCDWYLKLYFVTSNFHRDTGVGERMEKGTMPLHLQKDVLNDFVQGHTIIYIYFQTLKPLRSSNYIYISLTRLIKHR